MKTPIKKLLLAALLAEPAAGLLLAAKSPHAAKAAQIARGKYLVRYGDCSACHTPLKFGRNGPEPDMARYLSGHPEDTQLPTPPNLAGSPWFAATAGMTAWAGPWGVSYAANLTPDGNTGLGIWSEEMFVKSMRTGKHMSAGRDILPPMPWQSIATLNDQDIKAIYAYLRSLPPISNRVPEPLGPGGKAMRFE